MTDTQFVMIAEDSVRASAERLIAEAVGLLLEPLALDETLTAAELVGVADAVAESATDQDLAASNALSVELQRAVAVAVAEVALLNEYRAARVAQGLPLGMADARTSLNLLRHGGNAARLGAVRGVPDDALRLRRTEALHEVATLRQLVAARAEVDERYMSHAQPSLLRLNLDQELKALRDRGRLLGLIRRKSHAARERVMPHLKGVVLASSDEIAQILEQAKVAKRELARLYREWEARPLWTRWLLPRAGAPLNHARAGALDWVLAARDAGVFGTSEISIVCDEPECRFLAGDAAQAVRKRATESAQEPFEDEAAARLAYGLSIPSTTSSDVVSRWRQEMEKMTPLLARATLAVRRSDGDPAVGQVIRATLGWLHGAFGPMDLSRPELRNLLQEVAGAVDDAHVTVPEATHPAITEVVRELGQTGRDLGQVLSPRPPLRGPLRVAIAGRTKAGKTTLRKALTSDADRRGVGRGAHRTTRHAEAFAWRGIEFIDTPGIAAFEDDFDAETALAAWQDSDAVLWVYAETLRSEELDHLRELLAIGKPVLVVFNAKWRVDTSQRLDLFARRPDLAFRHMDGHAERVAQVAELAGTSSPQVLPAHLGAAFEALAASDAGLQERATVASRLPEIEEALHDLLVLQAQPLRAAALAEAVRTPLMLAAELIAGAAEMLPRHVTAARQQIHRERDVLARCADAAERAALSVLERRIAEMRARSDAFVRSARGSSNLQQRWQRFVESAHLDAPLPAFIDRLNRDTTRAGLLLEREHQMRRAFDSAVSLDEAPRLSFWRIFRSATTGALRRVVTGLLGGGGRLPGRGAAAVAARKVPWLGRALLAADAAGGAARGISDEAARSRIEESRWQKDAHKAVRDETDRLSRALEVRLMEAVAAARAAIQTQLTTALVAADAADDQLRSYQVLLPVLDSATRAVDLVLARRLACLCGVAAEDITRAVRTPGCSFDIWVRAGAPLDYSELVGTIRTSLRERANVHSATDTRELVAVGRRGDR